MIARTPLPFVPTGVEGRVTSATIEMTMREDVQALAVALQAVFA
jgi:hypothetical protein